MIINLAKKATSYFIINNLIEKDKAEIYLYGLEILIAECLSILSVLFLGLITDHFIDTLLFLAAFIPLRTYAGGFHSNTHLKCLAILILNVAVAILVKSFIDIKFIYFVWIIFFIPALVLIVFIAPVEHENKPLSNKNKKHNKKTSVFIFCIINAIIVLLCFFGIKLSAYLTIVFTGMYSAVISMAVSYIISARRFRKDERESNEIV